jgi:hypothetical protein
VFASSPGNPYDAHILRAALEQATILMQHRKVAIQHVVVLGRRVPQPAGPALAAPWPF